MAELRQWLTIAVAAVALIDSARRARSHNVGATEAHVLQAFNDRTRRLL